MSNTEFNGSDYLKKLIGMSSVSKDGSRISELRDRQAPVTPITAFELIWLIKLASSQDHKVRVWLENPPSGVMALLVKNGLAKQEPYLQVNRSVSCPICSPSSSPSSPSSPSCDSCVSWSMTPLGRSLCIKIDCL